MGANTLPIVGKTPRNWMGGIISRTANTALDGTGTTTTIMTADGNNGSFVQFIEFKPELHNTATTNTAVRIFINNGSSSAVAANNMLYDTINLPSVTEGAVTPANKVIVPVNRAIQAGYKILCCLATTAANSSWQVGATGVDF